MNIKRSLLVVLTIALFTSTVHAGHIYKEKEYQECWCNKAGRVTEYVLPDKTRVDCLTDEYAIEFDFAEKWAEAIGQALHYSLMTGKSAGIVLIGSQGDAGYKRAKDVIDFYELPIVLNTLRR